MSILQLIRDTVRHSRIQNRYEKVEQAIKNKARIISDLEFHRTMSNFYTERVMDINPHEDWWAFAQAKQKQYDHQMDFTIIERKVEEAEAKVVACTNAYKAAQKVEDEQPSTN